MHWKTEPYCRNPRKDIRPGRCLIWIYCSCKCKYYTIKYTVQGRWAFITFRELGGGGGVSFILFRHCFRHAWQIIRKRIRYVKNPSQIAAVVNRQFVLLVQSFTLLKGPLTYLLGLLLEKILAVQLKLLLPCISRFIAQYLLAILIYRCKYDVIGPHH